MRPRDRPCTQGEPPRRRRRGANVEWYSMVGGRERINGMLTSVTTGDTKKRGEVSGVEMDGGAGDILESNLANMRQRQTMEDGPVSGDDGVAEEVVDGHDALNDATSQFPNNITTNELEPFEEVIEVNPPQLTSPTEEAKTPDAHRHLLETSNVGEEAWTPDVIAGIQHSDLKELHQRVAKMMSWTTMCAIVTTAGTHRLTVVWYEFFAQTVHFLRPDISLPQHRSVRDCLRPFLLDNCFPKSHVSHFRTSRTSLSANVDASAHLPMSGTNIGHKSGKDVSRVIFPSEWAKLDVLTLPYFNDLISDGDIEDGPDINRAPMCQMRRYIVDMSNQIQVEDGTGYGRAWPEDTVQFDMRGVDEDATIGETIQNRWGVSFGSAETTRNMLDGILGPIWTVGADNWSESLLKRVVEAQHSGTCTELEMCVMRQLMTGTCLGSVLLSQGRRTNRRGGRAAKRGRAEGLVRQTVVLAEPGDTCAFVRPIHPEVSETAPGGGDIFCVYIARCRNDGDGPSRERILWLRTGNWAGRRDNGEELRLSLSVEMVCVVMTIPHLIRCSDEHKNAVKCMKAAPRTGKLEDGSKYVLYPMMLYHDDFHTSSLLFGQSSVGGCYMLPVGFSNELRSSPSAARPLSLTPTGLSSKEILRHIIPDILKGVVEGVMGVDPYGNPIRIFLDPVGFMADYPAVSSVLDVKSHTADAPCPLCSFTRKKNVAGSAYAYSVDVSSRRSANVRFAERSYKLRASGIDFACGQRIGMLPGDMRIVDDSPLHLLHRSLREKRHKIPFTDGGLPVVSGYFDPYMNTAVAPDHALMGIAKNALDFFFKILADEDKRESVDTQVCVYLRLNGLPLQSAVYNKNSTGIHSMSMTAVFSVLLIINAIADDYLSATELHRRCLQLMQSLQRLMSLAYWWPSVAVDGDVAEGYTGEEGQANRVKALRIAVSQYLNEVHELRRLYRDEAAVLDKPNLHRVLELCIHTVPLFGHIRNVREMPLESFHQVMKSGLRNNTRSDKHVTAMEHALCQDWLRRVLELYDIAKRGGTTVNPAMRGLLRLLAGEDAVSSHLNDTEYALLLHALSSRLNTDWIDPVVRHLHAHVRVNKPAKGTRRIWRGFGKGCSSFGAVVTEAKEMLCEHSTSGHNDMESIRELSHAAHVFPYRKGEKVQIYGHGKVHVNCVISMVVEEGSERNMFIEWEDFEIARKSVLFAVGALVCTSNDEELWAACRFMEPVGDTETARMLWKSDVSMTQLVKLTPNVRRAAAFHVCVEDCVVDTKTKNVTHSESVFGGGTYRIARRHDGYPPRMA